VGQDIIEDNGDIMARERRPRLVCEIKRGKRVCECKITGVPARDIDPRSFRTKVTPVKGRYIVVGCPKGAWDPVKRRCRVGTVMHKIVYPLKYCR